MNRTKQFFFILCLIAAICDSCKKNPSNNVVIDPITGVNGQIIINGTVYKDDGSPASNTAVKIDSNTIYTNTSGSFSFTGTVTDTNKVVIKFVKTGYFTAYRTLVVENNAVYGGIKVYLMPETASGTFAAATGGTITSTYVTLTFAANSVVKDDGTTYNGTVTTEIYNTNFNNEIPGDERAIDVTNTQVVMEAYGSFLVKLKGQAGENLKLSKAMNYNYPMLYGSDALAPANLKLWAFNETNSTWTESGQAALVNKAYVGSTTSLSFLQLAVPHHWALLRATLLDINKNVPINFVLCSYCNQYNYSGVGFQYATVNSKGVCLFYAPASLSLRLPLMSPCGDRAQLFTIDALQPSVKTNTSLLPTLTSYITSVSGKVEDCTFQPISGSAELSLDGITYQSPLVNGVYTFKIMNCGSINQPTVTVYDANKNVLKKNEPIVFVQGSTYQTAAISICNNKQTGTFTFTVAGQTYTFTTPKDTINYSSGYDNFTGKIYTMINGHGGGNGFYITTLNSTAGTFSCYTGDFSIPGADYFLTWGLFKPGSVTYTKYKSGTTLVEGTFKTNTTLNFCLGCSNTTVEVSGSFKIDQ